MRKQSIVSETASTVCYEHIERFARVKIQCWLQDLLEAEVTEFLGRRRRARRGTKKLTEAFGKTVNSAATTRQSFTAS